MADGSRSFNFPLPQRSPLRSPARSRGSDRARRSGVAGMTRSLLILSRRGGGLAGAIAKNIAAELGGQLGGKTSHKFDLRVQTDNFPHIARQVVRLDPYSGCRRKLGNSRSKSGRTGSDVAAVTNHRSYICAQAVRQRVNSILDVVRVRHERHHRLVERVDQLTKRRSPRSPIIGHTLQFARMAVEPGGEGGDFVQKQPSDYPSSGVFQVYRLLVLLFSDLGSPIGDLRRTSGCPVREQRDPNRSSSASDADQRCDCGNRCSPNCYDHGQPVRDGSYTKGRKPVLKRHNPSLLESILP